MARIITLSVGLSVAITSLPSISPAAWYQKALSMSGTDNPIVMVINEDQLKGKWKQFKGELKKKWGNFTDDDLLYIEGRSDKLEGKIQERYGDRRDEVKKWVDDWFEQNKTAKNMRP